MPTTLITGTKQLGTAGFAPRTALDGTPGTAIPLEGMYRRINVRFTRPQLEPQVVLADTPEKFSKIDVGPATGTINYGGYMAQGNQAADPLYFITRQYPGQTVNVFGTGNTLTTDVAATNDDFGFEARNNSARDTTFVITDTPTSDWVDGTT